MGGEGGAGTAHGPGAAAPAYGQAGAAGTAHGQGGATASGQGGATAHGRGGAMASGVGGASAQGNGGGATIQGMEVSWDRVAELFPLDPDIAYLNHGAFGVCPQPVRRAQQRLRDEMEANPMAFFTRGLYDRLAHTRRHVATFLGADPDGSALIPNASAATQIVFNTLGLVAKAQGSLVRAGAQLSKALALAREMNDAARVHMRSLLLRRGRYP